MTSAAPCPPPLTGLAVLAPSTRHADVAFRARRPRGLVLVLHAGGFVWGSARSSATLACRISHWGYDTLSVDYPPGDYRGAARYARARARAAKRRHLRVFAVGESAGGALAVDLAAHGLLRGAVAVAAPTDLVRWHGVTGPGFATAATYWHRIRLSASARARWSPLREMTGVSTPLLLAHSRGDRIVPYSQSARLHSKAPSSVLCALSAGHMVDRSWIASARRWLAFLTTRRSGSSAAAMNTRAICGSGRATRARSDGLARRG